MTEVKVGQVWQDCDKRMSGRCIRVMAIKDGKALCSRAVQSSWGEWFRLPGRQVRISLSRFKPTSTGYRLLEDAS